VAGDNYSAAWVQDAWNKCGLRYTCSELPKSQIYLECLPLFTRGLVSLPDHKRLLRELRLLERRTHRNGKDTVDHGARGSDDYSNATCGVLRDLSTRMSYMEAQDDPDPGREAATHARNEQYRREFAARIHARSGGQLWPDEIDRGMQTMATFLSARRSDVGYGETHVPTICKKVPNAISTKPANPSLLNRAPFAFFSAFVCPVVM
jgi:hypothetical protein